MTQGVFPPGLYESGTGEGLGRILHGACTTYGNKHTAGTMYKHKTVIMIVCHFS
jgi:hypothetical protein